VSAITLSKGLYSVGVENVGSIICGPFWVSFGFPRYVRDELKTKITID